MVMRFKFFMLLITFVMLTACGGSDDSSSDEIIPEIPSIIVDKTSINFDDTMVSKSSSTISVLVESKKLSEQKNTKFELVEVSKPVEKVLAMARKFL